MKRLSIAYDEYTRGAGLETDGSLVLTVIFPTLQESKTIKFDPDMTLADMKHMVVQKFKHSLVHK